jgi:hypothetical protein
MQKFLRNNNTAISFHNAITVVHTSTSILQKALDTSATITSSCQD